MIDRALESARSMTQENGLLREQVKTLEDQLNAPDKADSDDEPLNNLTWTQSRKEVRLLEAKVRELERVSITLCLLYMDSC